MKAVEQYFHVVLFIMLYKVVSTFESVDETIACDYSNESSVLSNMSSMLILSITLVLFIMLFICTRWFRLLILWMVCDHSNE